MSATSDDVVEAVAAAIYYAMWEHPQASIRDYAAGLTAAQVGDFARAAISAHTKHLRDRADPASLVSRLRATSIEAVGSSDADGSRETRQIPINPDGPEAATALEQKDAALRAAREEIEQMLAHAYERGWSDGCQSTLETAQDDPLGRCCAPHRDAMNEGCGILRMEMSATIDSAMGLEGAIAPAAPRT